MEHLDYKQYEKLGPFEIKDFVAKVALKSAEDSSLTYLNAGRGNPNWVATLARKSLISNGPNFSYSEYFVSVTSRMDFSLTEAPEPVPHDSKMIKTMPQIVSRVLPTA